ncbi:MAG: hypothetical protein AB7K24_31305 [Gemmataceae bacterium]
MNDTPEAALADAASRFVQERMPLARCREVVLKLDGAGGLPVDLRLDLTQLAPQLPEVRSRIETSVVDVLRLAQQPLKGRAIAFRAGWRFSSHLRQVLARMVQAGVIASTPDGYSLPE